MDWFTYTMSPHVPDFYSIGASSDRPSPFIVKPLSKEARMALKRKRKAIKKSRKKNR